MNDWQSQDKLDTKLRDKVQDYSPQPSDGLWGKLDARLDALAAPARKKRLGWYWVAAALITGIAGLLTNGLTTKEQHVTEKTRQIPLAYNNVKVTEPAIVAEETEKRIGKESAKVSAKAPVSNARQKGSIPESTTAKPIRKVRTESAPRNDETPKPDKKAKATPALNQEQLLLTEFVAPEKVAEDKKAEQPVKLFVPPSRLHVQQQETITIDLLRPKVSVMHLDFQPQVLALPVARERWPNPVSGFSVAVVNNISYSVTRYKAGSSPNAAKLDNAKLTNAISQGRVNTSFGLSAGLKLTDRLMFSAGFRRSFYSDKYSYDIKKAFSDPYQGTDPFLVSQDRYKHAGDSIMPGNTYSFINKFYCSEIPLTFSYYVPLHKKWNVVMDAGVSFMRVTYATAAYIDIDRVGFAEVSGVGEYPGFQMVYNLNLGMGLSYRLNNKISFEAAPYLRYGLNSMVKDKSWLQQTPAFFGINATMRYHAF